MASILEGVEYLYCNQCFLEVSSTLVGSKCYHQHKQGHCSKRYTYIALLLCLLQLIIVILNTIIFLVLTFHDLGWTDRLQLMKHK